MPITLNGDTGITTPTYGGADAAEYLVPVTAFKNRFINGLMKIDQRNNGAGQTIAIAGTVTYTVDRWFAYSSGGAALTGQRVAGTSPNQYNYQITGAASNTGANFGQRIEAVNMYDLIGSSVTLSVNMANSLNTTIYWTAYYPTATDNYTSVTQIAQGTFTVNSTLSNYSATFTVPSGATTGMQVIFYVANQTSGTWTIGNVQLEKGTTTTSFDYRPYGTELSLCQRYYYKNFPNATDRPFGVGQAYSTTRIVLMTPLKSSMRIAPTALEQSGTAAHYGALSSIGVGLSCNAVPTFYSASTENAAVVLPFASGLIAGNASFVYAFASGAYFAWSAEL